MRVYEPTEIHVQRAARAIKSGGLVVMPTETVYGVAADAWNERAVRRIFEVKQRPKENPIIVHIATVDEMRKVAVDVPDRAFILANRFWPGPLTLVLKKNPKLPEAVTAGADTVAIRMPNHPVALALIVAAGTPLAAPSANRFMQLSPTRAEAVDPSLADQVDMILDGGPCVVGLESTVVDLTVDPPRILRPGGISRSDIENALGVPLGQLAPESIRRSPGLYRRHYAPKAHVVIVDILDPTETGLVFDEPENGRQIKMPLDASAYGAALYDALHHLDDGKSDEILIEAPPEEPEWEAVWDRLLKASYPIDLSEA